MWVELNNHKHALRASGSCDIPKQTMANNQIKPYIFDAKSDPEAKIEDEQQEQRLKKDVSMWCVLELYNLYLLSGFCK